jgi:hypothetical protein
MSPVLYFALFQRKLYSFPSISMEKQKLEVAKIESEVNWPSFHVYFLAKMSKTAIASSVGKLHNDLHVLFCRDSTMTFFLCWLFLENAGLRWSPRE